MKERKEIEKELEKEKEEIISYTFTIVEQFLYFDKAKIAVL